MPESQTAQPATETSQQTEQQDPILVEAMRIMGTSPESPKPPESPPPAEEKPAVEAKAEEPIPDGSPRKIADETDFERLLRSDADVSKKKRAAAESKAPTIDDLKAKASKDRMAVLRDLGIDPSVIVAEYLSGGQPQQQPKEESKDDELKRTAAELKAELASLRENQRQALAYEQQSRAVASAKSYIAEKAKDFEVLSKYDKGADVLLQTLTAKYAEDQEYYDTNGTAPSFDDVATGVEKYAVSLCKKELEWMSSIAKLQPIIMELAKKITSQKPTEQQARTLDNNIVTDSSGSEEPKTESERVALAIKRVTAALEK